MSAIKVTQKIVDKVLAKAEYKDECWWDNTTIVSCKLANGWVITETSACVDPENYDHDLGVAICKKRIESKVWQLLGWSLICGTNGEPY